MKTLTLFAFACVISGCNSEPATEPPPTEAPAEVVPAATSTAAAAVPAPPAGDYVVVEADGTETPFTMNADGTWSGTDLKGKPAKGTWEDTGGKTCFKSDPPSAEDSCWTNQPAAADGTFMSTNDAGRTVTVKPAAK